MLKLALGRNILLIATLLLAAGVSAEEEDGQLDESGFARRGFYVGIGGSYASPMGWNSDFDNDLNEEATDLANQNATANYQTITPPDNRRYPLVPLDITIDGADLEDGLLGVNAVIGYRAGERVAFEVEVEWLTDSSQSNLDVESDMGGSTGVQTVKVEEIWTITANVKVYPPITGRFQPFGVFGVGLQHAKLEFDVETADLETMDTPPTDPNNPFFRPPVDVPADFQIRRTKSQLDGAMRLGAGIDVYATSNIAVELSATYVLPFTEVGSITSDYLAFGWRVLYRF